ncbi:hypothetical protein [Draconibacterium sediminis]|uniref:hypothetical protein n=1 Tax=Draconibacterium sediminis TaxID=1544798 RepID=UPI0026E9698C|nr:hypothetical protein [Draconibacterium sediminis]
MIKYKTQVGSKHLNSEARELRDSMKPLLRGMHCRKCNNDTEILFINDGYGHLKPEINACCHEFELRIRKKIWSE